MPSFTANHSGLLGKFRPALMSCCLLSSLGCAEDEPEPICPNLDNPAVLELANVTPEAGASVANTDIVHAFTVLGASGTFSGFTFAFGAGHTAGDPAPSPLVFTATATDADMTYTFMPVTWANTGHVELIETGEYADSTQCFVLPTPLFSYEVTP